jgi:hypothetical protein
MSFFRALVLLLLLASVGVSDELRTLDGKTVKGQTTAVTESAITLTTDAGPVSTPLSQVLALDIQPVKGIPAGAKYSDVRLLDDTLLHCTHVGFKEDKVELTLFSGAKINLPLNFMVSLVKDAHDTDLKKKFYDLASKKIRRDRVFILRDGELNPIDGTLGKADAKGQTIEFKIEGAGTKDIALDKLHGLVFYRAEAPQEAPICKVYDSQGNSLMAVKLTFDGKSYTLTTAFAAKISLGKDAVAKLDFNLGKLTFLSDLEPAKVLERSGVGLVTKYKKDTNLDGEPILFSVKEVEKDVVKEFKKGLSLHAHTELEYNLAGKYKEFKAVLGVDARTGAEGQPVITIYCDGEKRFSETITPKETRPLSLNVKDVQTLKIVVGSRNFLDLHDHATLADARVSQ